MHARELKGVQLSKCYNHSYELSCSLNNIGKWMQMTQHFSFMHAQALEDVCLSKVFLLLGLSCYILQSHKTSIIQPYQTPAGHNIHH